MRSASYGLCVGTDFGRLNKGATMLGRAASRLADKWIARHRGSAPEELRRCASDPSNSPEMRNLFEAAAAAADLILAERHVPERSAHSYPGRELPDRSRL